MNEVDTAALVKSAAAGDRQAFEVLVTRHAAMVTGVAYSVCGDFARSEDAGQEAFIEAWTNLATLREPEKFVGWICTIARRRAIDAVRADKTSLAASSIDRVASEPSDPRQLSPETQMLERQEQAAVWSMLERLPENYREPMVLFYRGEQSTRDVAIALGENESTIRQRLKRGREMIRQEALDTVCRTLSETAPKAAFAAIVMAGLPSATYAAGATATTAATTAVTGKSSGLFGTAASTAIGGTLFGLLTGLMGGVFGSWMSWKNCEYVSQQKFLVQQIQRFVIAFAIAAILFAALMYARLNGFIPNNATYICLLGGLLLGFQIFNIPWMIGGIRRYKQLGELAKANGEPMRESVRQTMDAAIAQSRIVQDDGSVVYEAFRWNAGAWMGTCIGCLAWMLPLAVIAFWHGARLTSGIVFGCCVLGSIVGWKMWLARHRLPAYAACQILVGVVGVLVIVVFAALQFLTNEATQEACQWTPWAWALLFLMPAVSLQLRLTRQTFHRNVQQRIQETS